ncbi:MAG: hypothetical protein NUW01_01930 [Gemmatimonadaceae bacterium]|nr:hypothetical protein [Gemmatimonadaceae bacterium]
MRLPLGWWIGWTWTHCNGVSSHTSAIVLARHPRTSITWTFAAYVNRRAGQHRSWGFHWWSPPSGYGSAQVATPVGGLTIAWQPFMRRDAEGVGS